MPRRLYPCTPSRLRAWLDCPRRYRMVYLDRPSPPKGPPWAHNSFGATVHNALAGWWRLPLAERVPKAAADLVERGWIAEGYSDGEQSARYLSRARAMVARYVAGLDPAAEPVGIERVVATKTELIAVSGRIDRLDDRPAPPGMAPRQSVQPGIPGRDRDLVVVDYKTGRTAPTTEDVRSSLALALYAMAAGRVLRRPCSKVELHHLPSAQVVGWEHTEQSLDRQLRRAEDIAAECAAADGKFEPQESSERGDAVFPPTPGVWCAWCDYRAHCPEGQLAAPAKRPWDGLADNEPGPS
ncbi:MAG TPA: PD-(D/E)XK nuclease family protein [Streptosporangiaceae bacterium]|nr:PD-(D/E)XK nuclease family protein [Streptosporangiaceae bacterium]